ncbi:MAG: hypothetical protein ABSE89_01075 [Sedimentisphaerales bacterium]
MEKVFQFIFGWAKDKIGYCVTLWKMLRKEHEWRLIKKDLLFERNFYWLKKGSGVKNGPFCVACCDNEQKLVHMLEMPEAYVCPKCNLVLSLEGQHTSPHISNLYRRSLFKQKPETSS